jgi:hypothetical protein
MVSEHLVRGPICIVFLVTALGPELNERSFSDQIDHVRDNILVVK